jgi:high-affinity iron transporter
LFANYLIGLREGLEASLVVCILIAYLVRSGNPDKVRFVWIGVSAAIGLSAALGALLTFTSRSLTFAQQEAFGGVMSIIAVGLVTWMVFWMKSAARGLKGELHGKLDRALAVGGVALAVVAFVAVAREGLETALFLFSAVQAAGSTTVPLTGALLGIATSVGLGWAFYRGALKLNLATFFKWTGAGLLVVAAGVLAYGIHDLQEAGILPGIDNLAFDVSDIVSPSGTLATLIRGVFNLRPAMSVLEVSVWFAYLATTMYLYLRPARVRVALPAAEKSAQAV